MCAGAQMTREEYTRLCSRVGELQSKLDDLYAWKVQPDCRDPREYERDLVNQWNSLQRQLRDSLRDPRWDSDL